MKRIGWLTIVNAAILAFAGMLIYGVVQGLTSNDRRMSKEERLPFYTTADDQLKRAGAELYRELQCRNCHTIWSVKSVYQSVPAPSLDGIGSIRSEQWLYDYFSAEDPQQILPSRLKKKYRHPSYAHLSEQERRTLARYFASMKVRDWYLDEVRKAEYEKLTGRPYHGEQ